MHSKWENFMVCELYPNKALIYKKVLKWKEKSKVKNEQVILRFGG